MLSSRLIAAAAAAVLVACAQADGTDTGAIRENVIEPGITAIDDSRAFACNSDASTFRTVLEIYEVAEGEPAPDEAALVAGGYVRSESELWDVVDGQLVAEHPDCGDVPTTIPAAEIVTDESGADVRSVDEVLATFTDDDVASFGGPDCARQLAVIFAGASQYTAVEGVGPDTMADVEAAGHFAEPVTMWELVDDTLRPTAGSECNDFEAAETAQNLTIACQDEARILAAARSTYLARFGHEPTRGDLIDARFVVDEGPGAVILVDLVDGEPRAVPGGPCEEVDLMALPASIDDCVFERRTLEVAVEAYAAQTGVLPTTEHDLVTAGFIRQPFEHFDVAADGTVVGAPDGACG